ncbi:hypothetical protein MY10362_001475 [Beauveria mimosiformis]
MHAERTRRLMLKAWHKKAIPDTRWSLPLALMACLKPQFYHAVLPRLLLIAFRYSQPTLIASSIRFVEQHSTATSSDDGFWLIVSALVIYLGLALSTAIYQSRINKLKLMTRSALTGLIHDKTMKSPSIAYEDGEATTLMSTDANALDGIAEMIHEIWAQVIEVAAGIMLLSNQVGWIWPLPLFLICGLVTHPANMVMTIVPRVVAAASGFDRIQTYLLRPGQHKTRGVLPEASNSADLPRRAKHEKQANPILAVRIRRLRVGQTRIILNDVNLDIGRGPLNILSGATGSGKSRLLRAILGEALARALFAECDLILLDDTFSGLDGDTEDKIFKNLFGPDGALKQSGVTVILASNSTQFFSYAEHIVVLGNHGVIEQGPWSSIKIKAESIAKFSSVTNATGSSPLAANFNSLNAQLRIKDEDEVDLARQTGDTALYLRMSATQSPFTHHIKIEGLETIRSFNWSNAMAKANMDCVERSQRPELLLMSLQRWLNLVLDILAATIAVGVVALAVKFRASITGAQVGIALSIMLVANKTLLKLVESWTTMETGKSTLFSALLRLLELQSGQIRLDGIDIRHVSLQSLRQLCFITASQDALVLANETLRFNLDPDNSASEGSLILALEKSGLWSHFNNPAVIPARDGSVATGEPGNQNGRIFDQKVSEFPLLSGGQFQLFSLSWALVKLELSRQLGLRPVVLLDELTSALDTTTELAIHRVIDEE